MCLIYYSVHLVIGIEKEIESVCVCACVRDFISTNMQQLSGTDSGLLFYCDLENILDGLSDFSRPLTCLDEDDDEASQEGSAETSR